MRESDESRAFARIVAQLRREDPRFSTAETDSRRRPGRLALLIGIALCVAAVLLISLGGPKGAVLALPPWLAGMILVIRSRSRH